MKKVLVVSYHYPPDGAVGSHRVDKLVRFLRNRGFHVSVLTVDPRYYEGIDEKRRDALSDPAVFRTACWQPPMRALSRLAGSVTPKRDVKDPSTSTQTEPSQQRNGRVGLRKSILVTLNYCPDDKLYWMIPALRKGISLARRQKFDWIIGSSPPHSVSIITYMLSRITRIKYALDYRDPWTVDFSPLTFRYRPNFINRFEQYVERVIVKNASLVVLNTEKYRESFQKSGLVSADKLLAVCNGFEDSDFKPNDTRQGNRIVLSHFGSLYLDRNPESFFLALDRLLDMHPELLTELQVRFFGHSEYGLKGLLANRKCGGIVRICPPIPYRDALGEMAGSDILLAFAQNQPYQVPAKLFDYLSRRKSILLLGSEGASFDLVNNSQAGLCASLNDEEEILTALKNLVVARGFRRYEGYDNSELTSDAQFEKLAARLNDSN